MLFNSIDFAIFLPVVFLLHWFCTGKSKQSQNWLILTASYVFYGWWDWRFLSLLLFSTVLDYSIGRLLGIIQDKKKRKLLTGFSIVTSLAILGIFKYLNFFVENFVAAFSFFGHEIPFRHLDIILPVGISFYTFQTMSYVLDVYKKKIEPTSDFVAFASFVGFFPQLVAGPIERATHLLPQFYSRRTFDYAKSVDGLRQILWGLFKKVVIADNCAWYVDMVFGDLTGHNSSSLVLAALLFPMQVYCDFSGYSDIAIGTARLFGVNLSRNFAFPIFSKTVGEFWRRWHISLYSWFRDYVFLPYVFKSKSRNKWVVVKATVITFILIGFWHGADWTFVLWGLVNAVFIVIPIITERKREKNEFVDEEMVFPGFRNFYKMLTTYMIVCFAAIMFRTQNVAEMITFYKHLFSLSIFTLPENVPAYLLLLLIIFQVVEWIGRTDQFAIEKTGFGWSRFWRWSFYIFIVFITGMYMQSSENPFIYFNF